MTYFNGTELRALVLATGLLLLGAAARLGFGPSPDDFSWTVSSVSARRPNRNLSATRRQVVDAVDREELAALPLGPNERIDPNSADVTELRRLPGVGPAKAQAIVKERAAGGPFRGPADLARVPGVGPRTVDALAPHLAFESRLSAGPHGPGFARDGRSVSLVDVNRAQIKELEQITGIGPALAARIVATRQRIGPFQSPDDLLRVPGIGPLVLQRIREQVRF